MRPLDRKWTRVLGLLSVLAACQPSPPKATGPGPRGGDGQGDRAAGPASGDASGLAVVPADASGPAVAVLDPAADFEAPYRCAADADCTGTCALGALNRAWWDAHRPADWTDCLDGCQSAVMDVRCVAGTCATVRAGDAARVPDPACTRRPVLMVTDGRWSCRRDADCVTTCAAGALNAAWLAAHPQAADCEDGCASKGFQAVCEAGFCATRDHEHKRVDGCSTPDQVYEPPYRCARDADCVQTCAAGALNADWYRANQDRFGGCRDGCVRAADRVGCVSGLCTSFRTRGGREELVEGCTRRPIELRE